MGGTGDPDSLDDVDVARTRVINSRVSRGQGACLVDRARRAGSLWSAVPADAHLADADPDVRSGLYDASLRLFEHFMHPHMPGIGMAKVSKVLYLKRPHLYPILDSRLQQVYGRRAEQAARRHQHRWPEYRRLYRVAIREDLVDRDNINGLACLRRRLADDGLGLVRRAANLSDLRLMDILTWQPSDEAGGPR